MNTKVAFALAFALSFAGIVGNHAEAAKRKPDLIVSAVSAPSSTSPGATIVVSGTIKNQGRASSKAFGVAYYLSTSPSSTRGAAVLGTENVSSLAAGASVAIVTSLAIPGSTTSGTYYVVAVVDSTKVISESNERNNTRASNAVSVTDSTPPTISAVSSSGMTASSATITWMTDEASTSQVEYGPTTAYGSTSALDTSKVTSHGATLNGLAAGAAYHFRVRSTDAAGNTALSSDYAFTTALLTTAGIDATSIEAVSYYQTIYDTEYQNNRATLDAMAASGNGGTYYTFQYAFGGTLSMYEATGDVKYLERALTWAETMISKATIIDSKGNRNWSGVWASPYSATPIAYQLDDLQGSTELARLAKLILTDATLSSAYGSRALNIYNFVRDHIVNKHFFSRGGLAWFQNDVTQTNRAMNDKTALALRVLTNLYVTSASLGGADNVTYNYEAILTQLATGFKGRFMSYQGGLIWDKDLGVYGPIPPNDPTTYVDTSHANRYPYAMVDLYKAGIVFTQEYITGVSTLFTNVIWNQSLTDPRFTNFIDGTNYAIDWRGEWGWGITYHGWVVLAEFDPQVLEVADATLQAILDGVSNPSLDSMDNLHGKIALSGHLAKAVAQ